MTRFGDFTLVDEIAESEVADCFEATHDVHGGPLFLKRYRRIDPAYAPALLYRCEVLMAVQDPNLAPHLGHGDVDGIVFAVSPFLEGIDLDGFAESVRQRRAVVKLEALLYIVREVAKGVAALHAAAHDGQRSLLGHGDVCTRHVRLGPQGEVWLTGLPTPRGLSPDRPPEVLWDSAGLGALLYDLIPLTRTGGQRPSLPGALDRVVRRTLGIGPAADQMPPLELAERLDEVAAALKLPRLDARLLQDAAARAIQHRKNLHSMSAADALPTLEPVLAAEPSPSPQIDLEPLAPAASADAFHETAPTQRPPALVEEINALPTEPPDARPLLSIEDDEPGPSDSDLDAFARRPTAPSRSSRAEPPPAPAAAPLDVAAERKDYPHRASTPLDELGSLQTLRVGVARAKESSSPPPPAASAPWVAPPDEKTGETERLSLDRLSVADEVAVPLDENDLPLDPFAEQTLPGHLVVSLPSDEPAAFEVESTPVTAPGESFTQDRTRPDASALSNPAASTRSDAPTPPVPSAKSDALPETREIPRAVSAIVHLDGPLRAQLGLLADPPENAAATNEKEAVDDDSEAAKADASDAFEEDPVVAALLARGTASASDVKKAREAQQSRGGKVPEILVAMGVTTDALIADALAAETVKPRLSDQGLFSRLPAPELCRRLPQTYALARRMLPLVLDKGKLTLAVADPFDDEGIRELARLVGATDVSLHVATRAALTDATLKAYRALGARVTTGEGTPSILLCMHDEDETARFGARLADEGFRVAHADDVPTAKMLLDAHPPAALLLSLDVEDAESLLVFARAQEEHADTPLFVTGEGADDDAMARVLDLGADDFFERSASLNVVMAKLRRALNKRGFAGARVTTPPTATSTAAVKASAAATKTTAASSPPPRATAPPVPEPAATGPEMPPPRPAASATPPPRPPPASAAAAPDHAPPPTFDFWENSAPLDELPDDAPGDTNDSGPMFAEPTGVMGTLRQMAVTEIVQSLEMGRKTARVELVPADGDRGMVGFDEGRVVYAECGDLRGAPAFYSLARHTEGFFRIRYGEGPSERNVEGSTTFLLLEAMRLMDEEGDGGDEAGDAGLGAEKTPTPFE